MASNISFWLICAIGDLREVGDLSEKMFFAGKCCTFGSGEAVCADRNHVRSENWQDISVRWVHSEFLECPPTSVI